MLYSYRARRSGVLATGGFVFLVLGSAYCAAPPPVTEPAPAPVAAGAPQSGSDSAAAGAAAVSGGSIARPSRYTVDDSLHFDAAARLAWRQFERLWRPKTGPANATPDYDKLTTWDMGSVLGALYAGRVLGFLDEAEYHRRMERTLRTISQLPLYRGIAFNRMYSATSARMIGRGGGPSTRGYGWSATDLGRILLWLRIVADNDPQHADLAARAVRRLRIDSIARDGYLHGEDVGQSGRRRQFQEGRIGYEQYSATGFAAWGARVAPALDVLRHARPVEVAGAALLEDSRGLDRLLSEPFILMGIETGWQPRYGELALEVLRAQENQAAREGKLIFASEDAVSIKPHYFYYYCVYCTRKPFVVEISEPGKTVPRPHWISTKTVFGWHALATSPYTRRGIEAIQKAASPHRGWSSGVLQDSGTPTYTFDINTAAVILEVAAYVRLGRPLRQYRLATAG